MRKTLYIINSFAFIALISVIIVLLSLSNSFVCATTGEVVADKITVEVEGNDIVSGYTYYLEWTGKLFDYNGANQCPSAQLKCEDDVDFIKEMEVNVLDNNGNKIDEYKDVGDYKAAASCDGITFVEENANMYSYEIKPYKTDVIWSSEEHGYIYNGKEQGPTAKYMDVGDVEQTIERVKGYGIDAGEHTASVESNAAGNNYNLGNLTCNYSISPLKSAVRWTLREYTFDGKEQGPTASYVNLENKEERLRVNGYRTEAGGPYTAKIEVNDNNYEFINIECQYVILPRNVEVDWNCQEYTYNGEKQSPNASYYDIKGTQIMLATKGGGKDAGEYTVSVKLDVADKNYLFTNSKYDYKILPFNAAVEWICPENNKYIYNGKEQGPTAKFIDVNDVYQTIEIVNGYGIDAGEYTASVVLDGIGNYKFTNSTIEYSILPLEVVVEWSKPESNKFTYNGKEQGPIASFKDINSNTVLLAVSGLQKEVGQYTASIIIDTGKHKNYKFTNNLTCNFSISKLSGKVLWVVADRYVENGEAQGPKAYIVGSNGDIIELSVNALGVKAGEYVAEIDMSGVDSKFDLIGDLSIKYNIMPEKKVGTGKTAVSIILGILLCVASAVIFSLIFFGKKNFAKIQYDRDVKEDQIYILQRKQQEMREEISQIKLDNNGLCQELVGAETSLSSLKKQLIDANRQLNKSKQNSESDLTEKRLKELEIQLKDLLDENESLKNQKQKDPGYFRRPIEDYLPDIDDTFDYAESCDYNPSDPEGSFLIQRQKLREIMKLITIYRSQRR